MMTGTPGPSDHRPGDGCTGGRRELTLTEGREVRSLCDRLIRHATSPATWDAIADEGSHLVLHYGTEGEWLLSGLLSRHITNGHNGAAPPFHAPQLSARVPEQDPQALALLATLASRHRSPVAARDLAAHLHAARLPVQLYLLNMQARDYRAARRHWETANTQDTGTPPLTALGFTALLILWAARCHIGAQPPSAHATAPLN